MEYYNQINQIMKYYNLTPLEFSKQMKVQRSSLSHINSGRNKPSVEFIEKLNHGFPDINIEWFITGKGEMIKFHHKQNTNLLKTKGNTTLIENSLIKDKNFQEKKSSKMIMQQSNNLKEITKIIWFYSDNTFEIFSYLYN